jgi:hypothetical protein
MNLTQKDLISEIREEQKRMAIEQLKLASNLSIFMNKQDLFNQKVIDILETNPLTKRKGIVEDLEQTKTKVEEVGKEVEEIKSEIKSDKKSRKDMMWIAGVIFTTVSTLWALLIDYIKSK